MMVHSNITYLIIPDVHGRDFWREPMEETLLDSSAKICFLGDYTDGYPNEWEHNFDYQQHTVDNFKEILELKKRYPERVTLLLGNHDCGYAIGDDICSSRRDSVNAQEIESLFQDNKELFLLAEEVDIAGRHFIFSHAGILKGWADLWWGEEEVSKESFNVVDRLNNAWLTDDWRIMKALGDYDGYRGWGGYKYGSPIWSDIRSWVRVTPEETFGFNIAGHTQVSSPVQLDQICCLDCRQCFYLDSDGIIRYWDTGEEIKKTEIN